MMNRKERAEANKKKNPNFYSDLAKMRKNPYVPEGVKGNSERAREIANIRWQKYRENKEAAQS